MSRARSVLIIATNTEKSPHPVYPLGASIVTSALVQGGYDVHGVDLCFLREPRQVLEGTIAKLDPLFVGLSIRAVDNVSMIRNRVYLPAIKKVADVVRAATDRPLVVGGSGYSLFPKLLLESLGADYGIVGEGEKAVVALADALRRGAVPIEMPGVYYRHGGRVYAGSPAALLGAGEWCSPDYEVFPLSPYSAAGGVASVQTRRGCSEVCAYCTYPLIEGRACRLQHTGRIVGDFEAAMARGVEDFFVTDSAFNLSEEHALGVCAALKERRLDVRWSAFIAPRPRMERLAEAMASSGVRSVELGSEGATMAALRGLGKRHSTKMILDTDRCFREVGVTPAHYFIFGGPNETRDTIKEGLELIDRLSGPIVVFLGVRIYPGTPIFRRAVREGVVHSVSDLLNPVFYFSDRVGWDWVLRELVEFGSSHDNFFVSGLELNHNGDFLERLRRRGRKGSLWEYVGHGPYST
ncbi:MAG: lipid biosynthesis B12-binding/radical SAM protein [Acidobacteriota bacterium]|nr:lipid biosynthesis B12-binding/radical SAM protein [Acidobacteriota bacterium]